MEIYELLVKSIFSSKEPVILYLMSYDAKEGYEFKEVKANSKETLLLIIKTLLDNHIEFHLDTDERHFHYDCVDLTKMTY